MTSRLADWRGVLAARECLQHQFRSIPRSHAESPGLGFAKHLELCPSSQPDANAESPTRYFDDALMREMGWALFVRNPIEQESRIIPGYPGGMSSDEYARSIQCKRWGDFSPFSLNAYVLLRREVSNRNYVLAEALARTSLALHLDARLAFLDYCGLSLGDHELRDQVEGAWHAAEDGASKSSTHSRGLPRATRIRLRCSTGTGAGRAAKLSR